MNKVKATLTVFTPAYNRAHTIGRTYESLCRQTCKDFEWLVVDDGSTDDTRQLVEGWITENKIPIRYIYQENQGMHGAHNTAYKNITTELNTCIDSDDWMPDDAVELIVNFWERNRADYYAGIIGLDYSNAGELIGTEFPNNLRDSTLSDFYEHGGSGDKKLVLRTDVVKKYPEYPRFGNERYLGLNYLYLLIDQDYTYLLLNKPLVIVDYQIDGSSFGMYRQYWNNPLGFMFLRKEHLRLNKSFMSRLRYCTHYVSHCIRANRISDLFSNPCPWITVITLPFGIALYFWTYYKVKCNKTMKVV
jgi:glycosyltransferase involved in cell wall biosynthesis